MEYRDINFLIIDDFNDTSFDCSNKNLTSLKGIEKFKNLKILDCSENNLTTLEELSNINTLEELYCADNNLTDLNGIENCKKLSNLDFGHNKVKSLKILSNLVELKYLRAINNNISSLEGIELLDNINALGGLHGNPCYSKYKGLPINQIKEMIFTEVHLNKESELRGKASVINTGLFDFKIK